MTITQRDTSTAGIAARRWELLWAALGPSTDGEEMGGFGFAGSEVYRIVLIEKSTTDGSHYLTSHGSVGEIADYLAASTDATCWQPVCAVDLVTGTRYALERPLFLVPTRGDTEGRVLLAPTA